MRSCLLFNLVAALCVGLVGTAAAKDRKPLVVLSLASYDDAVGDVESVGFVAEAAEMPTWLSSMFKLYAEGGEVGGLDASRPWGAVIQRGDRLSAFGFVPVTDADHLSWELRDYIASVTEVGAGVHKVVGTEPGKSFFATELNGWLFVSDSQECLRTVPADPAELLAGMQDQYDVAVRLELKNVSAKSGDKILAEIDEKLGSGLRKIVSSQTVDILGKAAENLDRATLGWSAHE